MDRVYPSNPTCIARGGDTFDKFSAERKFTITSLTRRPSVLSLNSKESLHLAPGAFARGVAEKEAERSDRCNVRKSPVGLAPKSCIQRQWVPAHQYPSGGPRAQPTRKDPHES
jgi:hypothetical protein